MRRSKKKKQGGRVPDAAAKNTASNCLRRAAREETGKTLRTRREYGRRVVSTSKATNGTVQATQRGRHYQLAAVNGYNVSYDPAHKLGAAIRAALDPSNLPGPVRSLSDMSPSERAALESQYAGRQRIVTSANQSPARTSSNRTANR